MKPLLKFLAVFLVILLLSSFLAPLLFQVLPFKFEKIFNRAFMIFSMVAAFLFVRVRKETLQKIGLLPISGQGRKFAIGFVSGVMVLLIVDFLKVQLGLADFSPRDLSAFSWSGLFLNCFAAGLIVGLLEEFFFRGFLFSFFRDGLFKNTIAAVLVTSVIYSLVHFIGEKTPYIDSTPTFFDSLRLVASPFSNLAQWKDYWPGALGLFIFGVVLNDLVIRTRSLYPCIGLHAGCVFFVKLDGYFLNVPADSLFWGGSKAYDGFLGWIALAALGLILRIILKPDHTTDVR